MSRKDWYFKSEDSICDLRTAGVLIRDGKLLVQREKSGTEYALPGGHVKIGETTADSLVREYREETGAEVRCVRLLWTEECFWTWKDVLTHSIAFYHEIVLCGGSDIPDTGEFVPQRDNDGVELGWVPLEKLADLTVYPDFLKEKIFDLERAPEHFVTQA